MKTIDDLIVYSVTDAAIEKLKEEYLPLKVSGIDDKDGYAACYKARIEVKGYRVEVEKRRKELKAESLEFGRKVDAEAKRITERLEVIENHLQAQQDIVDNEKRRIKEEEERKAQEKFNNRVASLQKYNANYSLDAIKSMSDSDYDSFLSSAKDSFEVAEKKRVEDQERLRVLEAERAEQAAKLKAQEEENRRLQAEIIAKQKAELAEKEAQLKKEREAKEAEDRKRAEEERKKVEAENKRIAEESAAKLKAEQEKKKAEAEAAKKVADKKLFEEIKKSFPTIESAWVEIARLRKLGDK